MSLTIGRLWTLTAADKGKRGPADQPAAPALLEVGGGHLGAAASGRSGHNDVSERIEEILASEIAPIALILDETRLD